MFTGKCERPDQHVHFRVSPGQVVKRATIRRLSAWAIILSNYSVRTLLITEEKFKEFCPLLWGEKDIIVNREDVLCPGLFCENQSVTWLCWSCLIDECQARVC